MATMTEAREFHPYEPVNVTRKPQLTLVAVKQRLDTQTQETTEVETVPVVQIEKAESPGVCDIPYFGKYYLFHRWFMTIEDVWSWKHSIPLAIIMAYFAWYTAETLCLGRILSFR